MSLIFDIKRFALNDGPGIRTTIFLKGCPLRCVWCHNPEGWIPEPQRLFIVSKCIDCKSCVHACPEGLDPRSDSTLCACTTPFPCVDACPTLALQQCGKAWTMDELMKVVEKERGVMEQSGGGVTLCGGEPLMHPEYLYELLDELGRRGFHRTVDTTLYASEDIVRAVASRCELFLVDLKVMNSEAHREWCGVDNGPILRNLRVLSTLAPFWIRIPLIEGVNADDDNIRAVADYLETLPVAPQQINFLPYHDIGKGKHERLHSTYNPLHHTMSTPSDALLHHHQAYLQSRGFKVIIGG